MERLSSSARRRRSGERRSLRAILRAACTVGCALVAPGLVPADAAAQKAAFVDALIAFRTALAGPYGDEGPQVTVDLDLMAASLARWDQTIAAIEGDLRPALPDAARDAAMHVRVTLASLYLERGRLTDALAEIDAAIQLDGDRAALHLLRGLAHEASGNSEEALRAFRQASSLDPADPVTAYLLAGRILAAGDGANIQPQIDVLLAAQDPGLGVAARAPPAFIQFALIEDSAADWPVFPPARYAAGFALVARGQYAEAIASFRTAASTDPLVSDPTASSEPMSQGLRDLRQNRIADAIGRLEAAVTARPESSEAHRILGLAYAAGDRYAEGLVRLETAVRLAPDDERGRTGLSRAYIRQERWNEAERLLRTTIEVLPESAEARWLLADLYERRGRGPEATRELEAATAFPLLSGKGQLYWRLADLHHRHQDFEAVPRALSHRARLDPNNATVHRDLGLAHLRRGSRPEALLALLMSSLLGPANAETQAAIGQIHLDAGRHAAAEVVLRRAVELAPDLAQARFALGTTLVRLGRVEEGRTHLAEFQRLRDAALADQRRTFAFEQLRRDAALRAGEGRHDLAAEIWRQVVAIEPENATHRVALADALAQSGQVEAAANELEAAATAAGDAGIYRQLADLYKRLGRAEESARARAAAERLQRERETGR